MAKKERNDERVMQEVLFKWQPSEGGGGGGDIEDGYYEEGEKLPNEPDGYWEDGERASIPDGYYEEGSVLPNEPDGYWEDGERAPVPDGYWVGGELSLPAQIVSEPGGRVLTPQSPTITAYQVQVVP